MRKRVGLAIIAPALAVLACEGGRALPIEAGAPAADMGPSASPADAAAADGAPEAASPADAPAPDLMEMAPVDAAVRIGEAASITAGLEHTCARLLDGTAVCWGSNEFGQLGDGTTTTRPVPVAVLGLENVAQIAASAGGYRANSFERPGNHTCARLRAGTVRCWGRNDRGQLGDGTTNDSAVPVAVTGLAQVAEIAVGDEYTCARLLDGAVQCWGANQRGQLGDGTVLQSGPFKDSPVPVRVMGLANVVALAAGALHVCARLLDGTVRCWGDNNDGQIGVGTTEHSSRHIPHLPSVAVTDLANVAALAAGHNHTCARLLDGTVRCWGQNRDYELGDGTNTVRAVPVAVAALDNVAEVAAAGAHTCARLVDGTVSCWGGNASRGPMRTPNPVAGLSNVAELAAGGFHNCARLVDGTVRCWGNDRFGQLGVGATTVAAAPGSVIGLGKTAQVAAGNSRTCARLLDDTVRCWGDNYFGYLGDGTKEERFTPVAVTGLAQVAEVAVAPDHACARLLDGTVRCWGGNLFGVLGDGTTANRLAPVTVTGLAQVAELAAGGHHTCARLLDGTVRCWGAGGAGALGDGTTEDRLAPVSVAGLADVTEIAAGDSHSCARLRDGTARCWGHNDWGALGDGTKTRRSSPVAVTGLANVAGIAAGGSHTCARLLDGTVRCWGLLGEYPDPIDVTPVIVPGLADVAELAIGRSHVCARLLDGTVRCWGGNRSRQLGDGTTTDRPAPVTVVGLSGVVEIAAGNWGDYTCARFVDGTVQCWGYNEGGQLGNGGAPYRSAPVAVIGLGR